MSALVRLREFTTSDAGRPALLGLLGAMLITAGGLGAGSTQLHDRLLETARLSWLRFGHGLVVSSLLLWTGVAVMLFAWLWLGRRAVVGQKSGGASEYVMIATTGFWLLPLLLSVPVFSRDTYSYLAQGALLRDGFDPYAVGPIENPNILLDNVSPIWTTTTAPYGPAFILIAKFATVVVGDHVIAGTMLLRLCMLPGLMMLIWATSRIARRIASDAAIALWICVLNPLVIIHLMGGVHNEMLMVGLMMAGIALTLDRRPIAGVTLVAVGVAVKATAGLALPFLVWVWMRQLRERRSMRSVPAFLAAGAASVSLFIVVFAVLSWLAGVGLGWLTALAGSVKIINWLTVPTAIANLANSVGGLFVDVNFYAVLDVTRTIGVGVIAVALPLLWWRFRHTDREALVGIASAMVVVVLTQSRVWVAGIAAFSTWIMVIFKPDGSHGMYSLIHVLLATACAAGAWYLITRTDETAEHGETVSPAGDSQRLAAP
jgi:alpha-1,6-mannosyltransferase